MKYQLKIKKPYKEYEVIDNLTMKNLIAMTKKKLKEIYDIENIPITRNSLYNVLNSNRSNPHSVLRHLLEINKME